MMLYADGLIQEIVDAVEEKGLSDNTLFVWISDNGGLLSVNHIVHISHIFE